MHELNVAALGGIVEAHLVGMLREQARPLVSLVAEEDGALAGHVMFTPVSLQGFDRFPRGSGAASVPLWSGPAWSGAKNLARRRLSFLDT